MKFHPTELRGVCRIELERREDERGSFARAFCRREFSAQGLPIEFVQANVSANPQRGTLRGMHLQLPPHGESKLVRCPRGAVFDVAVDLRIDSPTFARWTAVELSAANSHMLLIPEGVAHGYLTLADDSEVFYLVTEEYHPEREAGIRWDDPEIGIRWPFAPTRISEKDGALPRLEALRPMLEETAPSR